MRKNPLVRKASIAVVLLLLHTPLAHAAQSDWARHYSAGKDISLRAQCMDGYREAQENSSQPSEGVSETIATQSDLAVAEFEKALTGLSTESELVGRKKLMTLHALEKAQRLSHHPETASKTWHIIYGSFDENGRLHSAPIGIDVEADHFTASPEFRGSSTCPICYRHDGVVPITFGLIVHMPIDRLQPIDFEGRLDALLHQRRLGGCVVDSNGPNMVCNRCGIEFMDHGPNVLKRNGVR